MAEVRILGVGNPWRGDDGVGRAVAEKLVSWGVAGVRQCTGDATQVLDLLQPRTVIVDALYAPGERPGSVRRVRPGDGSAASSHGLGVAEALGMAHALGRPLVDVVVLGVVGQCFDLGEPLSRDVEEAVDAAALQALAEAHRLAWG